MEETITISKSELERLVAVEIAKQILPRTSYDFRNVAIKGQDVLSVNEKHPDLNEKLQHIYTSSTGNEIHYEELRGYGKNNNQSIFKRNRNLRGLSQWTHKKVSTYEIHETLRKLSVQLMGGTVIKDLEMDELDFALDVYKDFKHFFLEKYNQRLDFEEAKSNN